MIPPSEIAVLVARAKADDLARVFAPITEMVGAGVREVRTVNGLMVQVSAWPADQPCPGSEPADRPLTDCQRDCLALIVNHFRTHGRGLSGAKVAAGLSRANLLHGGSTIVKALPALRKRKLIRSDRGLGGYVPAMPAVIEEEAATA